MQPDDQHERNLQTRRRLILGLMCLTTICLFILLPSGPEPDVRPPTPAPVPSSLNLVDSNSSSWRTVQIDPVTLGTVTLYARDAIVFASSTSSPAFFSLDGMKPRAVSFSRAPDTKLRSEVIAVDSDDAGSLLGIVNTFSELAGTDDNCQFVSFNLNSTSSKMDYQPLLTLSQSTIQHGLCRSLVPIIAIDWNGGQVPHVDSRRQLREGGDLKKARLFTLSNEGDKGTWVCVWSLGNGTQLGCNSLIMSSPVEYLFFDSYTAKLGILYHGDAKPTPGRLLQSESQMNSQSDSSSSAQQPSSSSSSVSSSPDSPQASSSDEMSVTLTPEAPVAIIPAHPLPSSFVVYNDDYASVPEFFDPSVNEHNPDASFFPDSSSSPDVGASSTSDSSLDTSSPPSTSPSSSSPPSHRRRLDSAVDKQFVRFLFMDPLVPESLRTAVLSSNVARSFVFIKHDSTSLSSHLVFVSLSQSDVLSIDLKSASFS